MLPFLAKKNQAGSPGLIVKTRQPDQPADENDPQAPMLAAAQALIDGIKSGNAQAVADALQDAHELIGMPQEEPQMDDENGDING